MAVLGQERPVRPPGCSRVTGKSRFTGRHAPLPSRKGKALGSGTFEVICAFRARWRVISSKGERQYACNTCLHVVVEQYGHATVVLLKNDEAE